MSGIPYDDPAEAAYDGAKYYTLSQEQGLCLVGDAIVNLREVAMIKKQDGKTLVYLSGLPNPLILPVDAFDVIRAAVFAIDDDDDDDYDDDDLDD